MESMVTLDVKTACTVFDIKEATLRKWLFNRATNGLSDRKAVLQVGRKVLLVKEKFFEWLISHS